MKFLIDFILIFIVVYLIYYFMIIRKARRNSKKIPVEVEYLLVRYQIDLKKIKYKRFLRVVALVGSLDMALVGSIVLRIHGLIFQLLFGFILLIPIILLSFMMVGRYYQKKLVHKEDDLDIELEEEKPKRKRVTKEMQKNMRGERKNG